MTQDTKSASKGARGLLAGLFGRKPAPPSATILPRPNSPEDLQSWPWASIHDVQTERFGPLTPHAGTRDSGGWQMQSGPDGLRLCGNHEESNAITIGGALDQRLAGLRVTAEIRIHAMSGEESLAGLVLAPHADDRLVMGVLSDGGLLVMRLRGGHAELLTQKPKAPHPSGDESRVTLQVILLGEDGLLFVNGAFAGTVTDSELIGQAAGAGFHVKGCTDATLTSFTVEGLRAARP